MKSNGLVTATPVVVSAILGLVVIECVAMYHGINGKLFALISAAIAGLDGLVIPTPNILKK